MASTFGAATFDVVLGDDGSLAEPETPFYGSTRHVPGGGDVTQYTGIGPRTWQLRLFMDAAPWTTLRGLLQTNQTLTLEGTAYGTWALEALQSPIWHLDDSREVLAIFREVV